MTVNNGIMAVLDFGMKTILVKHVAENIIMKDIASINEFVTFALLFSFGVGIFMSFLILTAYPLFGFFFDHIKNYEVSFKLFLLTYAFQLLNFVSIGIYEGFQKIWLSKTLEVIFYLLQSTIILVFLFMKMDFNNIIYTIICFSFLLTLVNIILLTKYLQIRFTYKGVGKSFNTFYQIAKHVCIVQLSNVAYYQYPKVFILMFLNTTYLGIYDLIIKIPRFLKTLGGIVNGAILPAVSTLSALKNAATINILFKSGIILYLFVLIPIIFGCVYFSSSFFHLWLNNTTYHHYMQTYMIWTVATLYIAFGGTILFGMGKELAFFKNISWLMTVICIIATYIFLTIGMKLYGLILGQLVGFILLPVIFYKYSLIFNLDRQFFVKNGKLLALVIVPFSIFSIVPKDFYESSFYHLFLAFCFWSLIYWLFIYALVLNVNERNFLYEIYIKLKNKII